MNAVFLFEVFVVVLVVGYDIDMMFGG